MKIDIGINEAHREKTAQGLSRLLADSYTLYLKTHNRRDFSSEPKRVNSCSVILTGLISSLSVLTSSPA